LSKWLIEKTLVLTTARKMAEAGLVVGTSGNVSLRLSSENGRELLAITPTSRYYDLLAPEDVPVIDFETEPVDGELPPSSESLLHIVIYQARKNVRAIIHTHSVYASALAVAHLGIPAILEDQMASIGGEVKVAEYAPSASDELSQNVIAALEERNAVLLMNHGMLGMGKDMCEAFAVCELVEKTAKAFYLASTMGEVHLLSPEAVDSGKAFFKMLHSVDSI
jgi:L-fuculose-phosphate aldolase